MRLPSTILDGRGRPITQRVIVPRAAAVGGVSVMSIRPSQRGRNVGDVRCAGDGGCRRHSMSRGAMRRRSSSSGLFVSCEVDVNVAARRYTRSARDGGQRERLRLHPRAAVAARGATSNGRARRRSDF
jgi:hypothetical protein